jgi:hypothetical protein
LGEPPATEAILEGLWSIKHDDLDGLTTSLTFNRDQPPADTPLCWWNTVIAEGQWVSPDNFVRHCE